MLFWTPDITTHLNCWLDSVTERVVRCEVTAWNGTQSPEFERWISRGGTRMCIPLAIHDQQIDHIIGVVWNLVSADQKLVREFIENTPSFVGMNSSGKSILKFSQISAFMIVSTYCRN